MSAERRLVERVRHTVAIDIAVEQVGRVIAFGIGAVWEDGMWRILPVSDRIVERAGLERVGVPLFAAKAKPAHLLLVGQTIVVGVGTIGVGAERCLPRNRSNRRYPVRSWPVQAACANGDGDTLQLMSLPASVATSNAALVRAASSGD